MLLLAASAVSVRAARAENGETQDASANGDGAARVLCAACGMTDADEPRETPEIPAAEAGETPEILDNPTAAYAAELLRFDAGLVASTSRTGERTPYECLGDAFLAANRASINAFSLDLTGWLDSIQPFDAGVYGDFAARADAFTTLGERMEEALRVAANGATGVLSRELRSLDIPLYAFSQPSFGFGWKQWAALYRAYGEDLPAMVAAAVRVGYSGGVSRGATIEWTVPAFEEAASQGSRDQLMEAKLALAYLNTIYDDNGALAPVEDTAYPPEFLASLAHPLPGRTIKNGWCDPRSHRTRLHMGTDILAPARKPILAATDGVVLYIGYLAIPGNYVIIRDPLGYEYHYYHLNEITTYVHEGESVTQGQIIGRVGDTGNSAAYHLHLGIITPEYAYLNPYDVFEQAGIGPIRPD